MGTLFVLTGEKTEQLFRLGRKLAEWAGGQFLEPFSTDESASFSGDCYQHVPPHDWSKREWAWTHSAQGKSFGLERASILGAGQMFVAFTVAPPGAYLSIRDFREQSFVNMLTVHIRDESHTRSSDDIQSDVEFHGAEEIVIEALQALTKVLSGSGGIVDQISIKRFIAAGSLLEGAHSNSCSIASYDLNLGDEVWCQGGYYKLSDERPFLVIPRYSYAIVRAKEIARFPSFIAARFDLKVSLFFQGVILSNGPQVDPGYKGALFCMLYNGSDSPVSIGRGKHFSTIEFRTTTHATNGYVAQYQNKTLLSDFIPGHAAAASGGAIVERIEEQSKSLQASWEEFQKSIRESWERYTMFLTVIIPVIALVGLGLVGWAINLLIEVRTISSSFPKEEAAELVKRAETDFNELKLEIGGLEAAHEAEIKAQKDLTEKSVVGMSEQIGFLNARVKQLESKQELKDSPLAEGQE